MMRLSASEKRWRDLPVSSVPTLALPEMEGLLSRCDLAAGHGRRAKAPFLFPRRRNEVEAGQAIGGGRVFYTGGVGFVPRDFRRTCAVSCASGRSGHVETPARCCWRQCTLKATDWDLAPDFPLCRFHAECVGAERILHYLGTIIPAGTAPFRYPMLLLDRLKELGSSVEEAEDMVLRIRWPGSWCARADSRGSGMTVEELRPLVEDSREQVRAELRSGRGPAA